MYVDADNSINTAVRKIRQALHDNTEKPRFVVTIPARGYRFVAPVEKPEVPQVTVAAAPTKGTGPELPRRQDQFGPQRSDGRLLR